METKLSQTYHVCILNNVEQFSLFSQLNRFSWQRGWNQCNWWCLKKRQTKIMINIHVTRQRTRTKQSHVNNTCRFSNMIMHITFPFANKDLCVQNNSYWNLSAAVMCRQPDAQMWKATSDNVCTSLLLKLQQPRHYHACQLLASNVHGNSVTSHSLSTHFTQRWDNAIGVYGPRTKGNDGWKAIQRRLVTIVHQSAVSITQQFVQNTPWELTLTAGKSHNTHYIHFPMKENLHESNG